ncbi:MAG: transcription elongation factor GreA [Dehalococcoidia bacterium]
MTNEAQGATVAQITLGEALDEYLTSLKPVLRHEYEQYVRKYVEHADPTTPCSSLSGSRVESYAETQIRSADPNAQRRVAALKAFFQFLKKKNYCAANYGINVRVRRTGGRTGASAVRIEEAPIEMTADGLEALKQELADLEAKVPDLVKSIALARSDGDLRENAPYHAAREALAFTNDRKQRIETSLKRAVVVDASGRDEDLAALGSMVTVTYLEKNRQETYQLVSSREANARERRISVESPVGRVLLGRRVGDEVQVDAPQGAMRYRIDSVAQTT